MRVLQEDLDAKQKDKDFIRNYLRQLNPGKKQPMQGSFKPQRQPASDANSLVNSHVEPPVQEEEANY